MILVRILKYRYRVPTDTVVCRTVVRYGRTASYGRTPMYERLEKW